jgi:hypothetical protein
MTIISSDVHDPSQSGPSGVLRFEQRFSDRWQAEGVATAFQLAGEQFGTMHTLRLIDYSSDGLGALCDTPIEPGTLVSVGFQAPGRIAKRGAVTRCLPCGDGYHVGIQFEARLAA